MIALISNSGVAAASLVAGSLFARVTQLSYLWIAVSFIFLVLLPFSFCAVTKYVHKKNLWVIFVIPAFLYAGWIVTEIKTDKELKSLYPFVGAEAEIGGTICSEPVNYGENTSFIMETEYVKTKSRISHIREKIKVSTSGPVPNAGTSVVFTGELKPVSLPRNSTSFNSSTYHMRKGVFFSVFTESVKASDEKYTLSIPGRISLFISTTTDLFIRRFPPEAVPFIKAIVLNNKTEIPDEILNSIVKSGTYRYLYCPYLHITMLIFILGKIFGERKSGVFAGICIFVIYLFMNITIPSAWKICLFLAFSYLLMVYLHIGDIRIAMYLTVIFTGLISPLTLTEPGFILSVGATIIVRCFNSHLRRFLYFLTHNRKLSGFLAIYLTIMVGIYPLSSFFGFPITPWSMVIGLLLMPLIAVIYILFYISYTIFILSGSVWSMGVPFLVWVMEKVMAFAAQLPFANLNFGNCSLLFVVAFYAILYCIYRRITKRRSFVSEILTCLLCFVFASVTIYGINDTEVTFLSVGNSDCAIISFPNGKTMMVDGGGSEHYSDFDIGAAEVIPYLEYRGINKIDTVVVSHYDKDHADGIVTVMRHMQVKEIFMPDYLPNNDYRDIIEEEAIKQNTKLSYISEPCTVNPKSGGKCEFLYCDTESAGNDGSLVARITLGKTAILFTGDISSFAEYNLPDTRADIIKVPHHGSRYSSSEKLIETTDADFGVICVGENNPYGHPAKSVLERYEKQGTDILRTDLLGDIHFIIGKTRIKRIYGFRERFIYGGF